MSTINYGFPIPDGNSSFKAHRDFKALGDAIDRTLKEVAESLKIYKKITDFNCVGDGVTDSTEGFKAAVSSMNHGETLFIPYGTFIIGEGIVIPKHINIIGLGKDYSCLKFTHVTGTDCLNMSSSIDPGITKRSIRDFRIEGNPQTGNGLSVKYLTDSEISNVSAEKCGGNGFNFEKGWVVSFRNLTAKENKKHGIYTASLNMAFSEINAINIENCNLIRNEKIGIVVGSETNNFDENTGYGINIKGNHFSENGIGNIQMSGARSVNVNEGNYFEVVGTKAAIYGVDPFHIYVGKRSGSGTGMCQEITIEGNHFNAMNDSRYGANNLKGYGIVLDYVIGVNIGKNHFYKSVQGSILATSNARRIDIKPNSVYESAGNPFLTDQTNEEIVYWEQVKNTVNLKGEFGGKTFANQGFENIVRNGEFLMTNASNVPLAFTPQSFTFTKEADGTLVATADGGGYAKLLYTMPSNRLADFKNKHITLTIRCKVPTGNSQNFFVYTNDGITEVTQSIAKNDTYSDVSVTRKISDLAYKLEVGILNYNSPTIPTDKVYLRSITATKGKSVTPYQKNPSDHHFENLTHHGELSLPNLKVAADNAAAIAAGVPSLGIYRDSNGNLKVRTT